MSEENNQEEIIIGSSDSSIFTDSDIEDAEHVKLYGEKEDQAESQVMTVDPNFFITTLTISVTDLQSKFNIFKENYFDTMLEYKEAYPEKWKEMVSKLKEQYTNCPTDFDNTIELLAALAAEYKSAILSDSFKSEFVKELKEFKKTK